MPQLDANPIRRRGPVAQRSHFSATAFADTAHRSAPLLRRRCAHSGPRGYALSRLGELSGLARRSMTVAFMSRVPGCGTAGRLGHSLSARTVASRATGASQGGATLLFNASHARALGAMASTSGTPRGCSDLTLAIRTMVLALSDTLGVC